jgi:hypothetical protein
MLQKGRKAAGANFREQNVYNFDFLIFCVRFNPTILIIGFYTHF